MDGAWWVLVALLLPVGACAKGQGETSPCAVRADCPEGWACFEGTCWNESAGQCPPGRTGCEGRCVDLQEDPAHCGACGNACPSPMGATASCQAGRCRSDCLEGRGDCDGDPASGCETDLLASTEHCGACGNACPSPMGATASCQAGRCRFDCLEGRGDCDGDPASGCETDLLASTEHCGACGQACAPGLACQAGRCVRPPFGTGADGDLVLGEATPEKTLPEVAVPVVAEAGEATATVGADAAFEPGQLVMLHQSRAPAGGETPPGTWTLRVVVAVDGRRLTLDAPLEHGFRTSDDGTRLAQLLLVPQYRSVRLATGSLLRTRPWNGRVGGILALVASEGIEVAEGARIGADGSGYRGGGGLDVQGEGQHAGPRMAIGGPNGVGGGTVRYTAWGTGHLGGGGGHDAPGQPASVDLNGTRFEAPGGAAYPDEPGRLWFGGGGAGAGFQIGSITSYPGASGGGVVYLASPSLALAGQVTALGGAAGYAYAGSGAGGTVWIRTEGELDLGTDRVRALGGDGGAAGGVGRVVVQGASSVTGRSQPRVQQLD